MFEFGLRSKQKSAGEVMNHHSSVSSSLSEGRCAGGEGGKTFTSAAACCVLNFVVATRWWVLHPSSSSCAPTFSPHSPASTSLLWTFSLYTSSRKWGIWKLLLDSFLHSTVTAKRLKTSIPPKLLGRLRVPTRPAPVFWFRYQQGCILN